MGIVKQHTLLCPVSDMERAIAFYQDVLGLTVGYTSPHFTEIMMDNVRIGLHPPFHDATLSGEKNGWVIGVQTEDIEALRIGLVDGGFLVSKDYHDTPGGVVMDFQDPDGNPLQAIQLGLKATELTTD